MVNIALVFGLLVCSYTDYRYNRIYNWVTLPLIGFGLLVNGIYGRWPGFLSSLYGCIAASLPISGLLMGHGRRRRKTDGGRRCPQGSGVCCSCLDFVRRDRRVVGFATVSPPPETNFLSSMVT